MKRVQLAQDDYSHPISSICHAKENQREAKKQRRLALPTALTLISLRTQKNSLFAKDLVLEHKNKRNAKSSAKSNAKGMSLDQSMADNSKPLSDDGWSSSRSASHRSGDHSFPDIASDA